MLEPPRIAPASPRLTLGEILGPKLPTDDPGRDPPTPAAAEAVRLARARLPPGNPELQDDW
eukprot:2021868-Alexandrium_andersonii.AAC.1